VLPFDTNPSDVITVPALYRYMKLILNIGEKEECISVGYSWQVKENARLQLHRWV
jgi:hypothetical protein